MRWQSGFEDRTQKCAASAALLISIFLSGCGSSNERTKPDAATMATISGSMMNDGKAISLDSDVIFYCSEKNATAAGKVDALGKFSLKEADPYIGIPPGRYVVTLRPPAPPPVQVGTDDYKKMMSGGANPTGGAPPKLSQKASDIPERFLDAATSKLALEVKSGPNNFDIDLAKIPE